MKRLLFNVATVLISVQAFAQSVGLIQHSAQSTDNGYVLFAPIGSNTTYLIDKCGKQLKTWSSAYKPGQSVYLLNDGTLLHTGNANNSTFNAGGKGGVIEKIDWNGNVIWSYTISDTAQCQHHDVKAMPNGNVLVICWESKTSAQAIAVGRNPAQVPAKLWSEKIYELQPVGTSSANIVWEWHLWDHLVQDYDNTKPGYATIAANPQLVNINYNTSSTNSDWIHMNAIDYNPALNQILLSSHAFSEIWVIDHSTSTAQAASHTGGNSGKGGDIIYRWGNPRAYNNGTTSDQKFFGQHNAHWIESGMPRAGQIMVFNNGLNRTGGNYSTAEIIVPPLTGNTYSNTLPYLPTAAAWIYNAANTKNYYAQNISSAQQLSNGHVLLCNGPAGVFTEVDSTGNTVWEYVNPVSGTGIIPQNTTPSQNLVFRCNFYPTDFAGFVGKSLSTGSIIENTNTLSATCNLINELSENNFVYETEIFPNPANDFINIKMTEGEILIYDISGKLLYQNNQVNTQTTVDLSGFNSGLYLVKIKNANGNSLTKKLVVLK